MIPAISDIFKNRGMKVISGGSHPAFADAICKELNINPHPAKSDDFSDGEPDIEILKHIRDEDVFIVQSTHPSADNIWKLGTMIDAALRASAGRITAVIPYFGYARQDRKEKPRVPITAKVAANFIQGCGANRILTMDLHADQIPGFFDIPVDHLSGVSILAPHAHKYVMGPLTTVLGPDEGSVKIAKRYADYLDCPLGFVHKKRSGSKLEIVGIIGEIEGRDILIIDDMIDTAGTMEKLCFALRKQRTRSITIMGSHGVFSGKAVERFDHLQDLKIVSELIVLDTHPRAVDFQAEVTIPTTILSAAPLFAQAIESIHKQQSVSKLFI